MTAFSGTNVRGKHFRGSMQTTRTENRILNHSRIVILKVRCLYSCGRSVRGDRRSYNIPATQRRPVRKTFSGNSLSIQISSGSNRLSVLAFLKIIAFIFYFYRSADCTSFFHGRKV